MREQIMLATLAAGFLAAGVSAQSLQLQSANYPGIYCRFDSSCNVSPMEQSDTYAPTNVAVSCVLESRSFPGNSADSQGQYGYEYRLTLNNNSAPSPTETNVMVVDSLTLAFGAPVPFAFGMHASNDVWVVTTGGPVGLAPSSANLSGTNVTINFDPPLQLETDTDQTTNTCYFGMISSNAPQTTTATLAGWTEDPVNGTIPYKALLNARTP